MHWINFSVLLNFVRSCLRLHQKALGVSVFVFFALASQSAHSQSNSCSYVNIGFPPNPPHYVFLCSNPININVPGIAPPPQFDFERDRLFYGWLQLIKDSLLAGGEVRPPKQEELDMMDRVATRRGQIDLAIKLAQVQLARDECNDLTKIAEDLSGFWYSARESLDYFLDTSSVFYSDVQVKEGICGQFVARPNINPALIIYPLAFDQPCPSLQLLIIHEVVHGVNLNFHKDWTIPNWLSHLPFYKAIGKLFGGWSSIDLTDIFDTMVTERCR